MTGIGYKVDTINKFMLYFWMFIAILVAGAIYFILYWHDKHEDGE